MNAPTPASHDFPHTRVRCAACGKWGLHVNGPQCLTCGAYLPLPGAAPAATPRAAAPGWPPQGWPPQGWPPQSSALGWQPEANYPAYPVVRRRRRPRWAWLLGSLVLVVILKAFSAVVLQPTVMSSQSKLWALLDLLVQVFSDVLLLFIILMAIIWGIAWLVKAVRGR